MNKKPVQQDYDLLRKAAEAKLVRELAPKVTVSSTDELLHELQVHQIELEMQNEELRRTQTSLEESRDSFVDFYEFSPVGYFTITDKGLITNANLTGAALLGRNREKLLQQPFSRYLITEEADRWYLYLVSILKKENVKQNCELILQHEDGLRLYVRLDSLCFIYPDHQKLVRVVMTDISEQKLMEMALHQSEELKTATLNSLSEQIAVLDHDGVILEVNDAWRRFAIENSTESGKPAKNTEVGVNYLNFYQGKPVDLMEDTQVSYDGIRSVIENRLPSFSTEYPCHSPNEFRWFLMCVNRLNTKKGGAVISHTNITAQKMAEVDLRIAAVAFQSQLGVMISDANNVIIRVNHAFTQITGYSDQEVIGKNPRLLNSGCQSADFYAAMWNSIKRDGGWNGEIWNKRKSGEIYPEHLNITVVKNQSGTIQYYVATLTDITMSRAAADEIRQLAFYDTLTRLPNRRLLNDRLTQALAASKRSSRHGGLMFIDLDNFKPLNDRHGHVVGDLLLIEVADRLKNCVREMDTVARFGGDEFVVILSELDACKVESITQAGIVAEKIRSTLSEPYRLTLNHEGQPDYAIEHYCTASIGVALFINHEGTQEDISKRADMAMYQAKEAGRNQVRFYEANF
jgi:diguanylate cyclase (GGDEF)-like protein/PAS domain S-box-containing protein